MSWIRRSAARAVLAGMAATAVLGLSTPTWAAKSDQEYVKYYTVLSKFEGKPENLTEVATRMLGDGARSIEVFNLNTGRKQPGGGQLSDPNRLNAGWMLVLPWDAYGAGVQYGVLPAKAPKTSQPTPAPEYGRPAPDRTGSAKPSKPGAAGKPSKSKPANKTSKRTKRARPGQCATISASSNRSDWARLRLAADQAWPQSRGKGQLVAVIDSGVDGSVPQLAGHVAVGTDIVSGSGRGDTDCLGTGTAMAGLIVAQPNQGSGVAGIAPDATVMPVRITDKKGKVKTSDSVAAIGSAVSEGATVIVLGSHVDLNKPEIAKAATQATDRGVAVVAGAPLASKPVNPKAQVGPGVLRVGGIGVDGQAAAGYLSGSVHVVAPGVNVSSVGITGTGAVAGSGTTYAVAFVAGEAALVRAAYPDLSAKQVAHRIQVTADKVRDAQPDNKYGWGLINPAASVTKVLPEEAVPDSGKRKAVEFSDTSKDRSGLLLILALVATAAAVLMVLRIRKLLLDNDSNDDENDDDTGEGQPNLFTPRRPDANGSHDPPPPPPPGQIMVPPSSPVANQSAAADSAEVRPFQRPVEAAPVATAPLPKRPVAGSDAGAAAESVEVGQKTEKVTETR